MSRPRTLIVFGAGPGIGNHVASAFARTGHINHIILLSRNTARLQDSDAPFVQKASSSVKLSTLRIDLADLPSLPGVLKELDALTKDEDVEIIFFNAARIQPSEILTTGIAELDEDFKTTNLALYVLAQHYLPRLAQLAARVESASQSQSQSGVAMKPSLLVTNSALPHDPIPQLLSLSLVKAAQRNMAQSLRLAFSDKGVQVGLVTVEGQVGPDEKERNPENIARRTVEFWKGGREAGLEVKI